MQNEIKEQLIKLSDDKYKKFSASLLPGTENMLGVRLPQLRKLAKKIARENWEEYLETATEDTFEEIMLQGMVLGYLNIPIEDHLARIALFIPKINNWSVCDSFCSGLKFTRENMERVWKFLLPYLRSEQEFEIRFGVVMLIYYYITAEYAERAFKEFDQIDQNRYYAWMAVAWAISIYFKQFPEMTAAYLRSCHLTENTYKKALQKIKESNKFDESSRILFEELKGKIS